jgi:hypothetical protein
MSSCLASTGSPRRLSAGCSAPTTGRSGRSIWTTTSTTSRSLQPPLGPAARPALLPPARAGGSDRARALRCPHRGQALTHNISWAVERTGYPLAHKSRVASLLGWRRRAPRVGVPRGCSRQEEPRVVQTGGKPVAAPHKVVLLRGATLLCAHSLEEIATLGPDGLARTGRRRHRRRPKAAGGTRPDAAAGPGLDPGRTAFHVDDCPGLAAGLAFDRALLGDDHRVERCAPFRSSEPARPRGTLRQRQHLP